MDWAGVGTVHIQDRTHDATLRAILHHVSGPLVSFGSDDLSESLPRYNTIQCKSLYLYTITFKKQE